MGGCGVGVFAEREAPLHACVDTARSEARTLPLSQSIWSRQLGEISPTSSSKRRPQTIRGHPGLAMIIGQKPK